MRVQSCIEYMRPPAILFLQYVIFGTLSVLQNNQRRSPSTRVIAAYDFFAVYLENSVEYGTIQSL